MFKKLRNTFDKYTTAAAYAEVDCKKYAKEVLKPTTLKRLRKRPRLRV